MSFSNTLKDSWLSQPRCDLKSMNVEVAVPELDMTWLTLAWTRFIAREITVIRNDKINWLVWLGFDEFSVMFVYNFVRGVFVFSSSRWRSRQSSIVWETCASQLSRTSWIEPNMFAFAEYSKSNIKRTRKSEVRNQLHLQVFRPILIQVALRSKGLKTKNLVILVLTRTSNMQVRKNVIKNDKGSASLTSSNLTPFEAQHFHEGA